MSSLNYPTQVLPSISFFCLGLSSWIAINASFNEIPVWGPILPEGYGIANRITLLVQLANIVPFVIFILRQTKYGRGEGLSNRYIIWCLLIFNIIACIITGIVWNMSPTNSSSTTNGTSGNCMWQNPHGNSWVLYIMIAVMGIVDCTTTITFWPFVTQWSKVITGKNQSILNFTELSNSMTIWLATGEATGGFLLSLIGMAQTINRGWEPPRFSCFVYFLICAIFGIISLLAFAKLDSLSQNESHIREDLNQKLDFGSVNSNQSMSPSSKNEILQNQSISSHETILSVTTQEPHQNMNPKQSNILIIQPPTFTSVISSRWVELLVLLIVNFWENGVYASILPNAVIPFGEDTTYRWATYLPSGMMALAIGGIFWFHKWTQNSSRNGLGLVSRPSIIVATIISSICMLGLLLPAKGIIYGVNSTAMHFLIVINCCFIKISIGVAKTCAFMLLGHQTEEMLAGGLMTQLGSFTGAFLFYYLLNCPQSFRTAY